MWKWFLAYFRFSEKAVCEMSNAGHGVDYHDYPDATEPLNYPMHFYTYTCKRCGKKFTI